MVSVKPNEVEGVALREGSILRCMNVLRWDSMDGQSNIGEKGDDGPEFPIAGSKVEVHIVVMGRQKKKGHGMSYKVFTSSSIVSNVSLSDLDFVRYREAILREVNVAVCLGAWALDNCEYYMVAVYAPCVTALRLELWEKILELTRAIGIPCYLRGNFNEVNMVFECRGYVGDSGGMADFVSFINDGGFVDLLASDMLHMWFGYGSKIDFFYLQSGWIILGEWNNITFHVASQIIR
ncbi:hypothetical protein V6N13_037824 [Hibiscus sabdariffa]